MKIIMIKNIQNIVGLLLFIIAAPSMAQIVGETDAVSITKGRIDKAGVANESYSILAEEGDYNDGYSAGYDQGYEDGLLDASTCDYGLTPYGIAYGSEPSQDYLNGHKDGWLDGYDAAYDKKIDEFYSQCNTDEYFDESSDVCSCVCIQKDWVFDGDGDGYYAGNSLLIQCDWPGNGYVEAYLSGGEDCDDNNSNVHEYASGTYYWDGDGDGYHNGTTDTPLCVPEDDRWIKNQLGEDCNDADPNILGRSMWYHDSDGDGYHDDQQRICDDPGYGWSMSTQGEDCAPNDAAKQIINNCGDCVGAQEDTDVIISLDLDLDGYHSTSKTVECYTTVFYENNLVGGGRTGGISTFPDKYIQSGSGNYTVNITELGISFTYNSVDKSYTFPSSVVIAKPMSLDCDDLDDETYEADTWVVDEDEDGYYDSSIPAHKICSKPSDKNYIKKEEALGVDCDDSNAAIQGEFIWYKDVDGDGYYVATQRNCTTAPALGWTRYAPFGPDTDDNDPFTPSQLEISCNTDFIVPSLLEYVWHRYEDDEIWYQGNTYAIEDVNIEYGGTTYNYLDIIFDEVTPDTQINPPTLIIPSESPLYGAELLLGNPTSGRSDGSTGGRFDGSGARIQGGGENDSDWVKSIKQQHSGTYTTVADYVPLSLITNETHRAYFDELFESTAFNNFTSHYDSYAPQDGFAVQINTFEEEIIDGVSTNNPIFTEKIGSGDPVVYINARKTWNGDVEYVVSIDDSAFEATGVELDEQKGVDADGNPVFWTTGGGTSWINPEHQEVYQDQLLQLKEFREGMPFLLARDYDNVVNNKPTPPNNVPNLDAELYPEYNYGEWGFVTKLVEFFQVGHYVGHEFKMPEGTWDPDAPNDDWNRWRTKAPSSVAGVVDEAVVVVEEFAGMVKLAKSLTHKETWVGILEAVKNFDIGEQINSMIDSFQDELSTILGDHGVYKQYHSIGKVSFRVVKMIYAGWSSGGKYINQICGTGKENPVRALDKPFDATKATFRDKINKSPEFDGLSKSRQNKLTKDIAEADESFGDALAGKSNLIDNHAYLDDANVDKSVRTNSQAITDVDAVEDAVEISGKSQPTWLEIQALWKRGNDFNKKAVKNDWYDYHEIHLANGKRLDSYDPDLGEIVSRKATDFDNIQSTTFENYLKEFNQKYSSGTVIRSNKYPDINGQTLQGNKILEVPASNQNSPKFTEFTNLASQYHVTIRYRP